MGLDDRSAPAHPADLEQLMGALEVEYVRLAECQVSPGWRLAFQAISSPGLHYNLAGYGRMVVADRPPIELAPHTIVILPAHLPFRLEVPGEDGDTAPHTVERSLGGIRPGHLDRFTAGPPPYSLSLICGYFRAGFGAGIDPFASLGSVLVETFEEDDRPDHLLKAASEELASMRVGAAAMTCVLLKQVLLTLIRRSLTEPGLWAERFSALSDPQLSRAFSEMLAHPGAPHTIDSLARRALLSRSAFMARFAALFGLSPMTALRQLRMKRAASLLAAGTLSIEQVACDVGYASRSSFIRAFRLYHGSSPVARHLAPQDIPLPRR
ncbi:AraC family transcriptional regulator [Pinirhizobacter sp.]|jgi:AraC family transcriptional activator of mtrCDE|uniref:helix-turn-helix transcriptional regulator n=1 Tax=Pinirhizobacter sp. TaxID=2950432 RepID=UPI002F3EA302